MKTLIVLFLLICSVSLLAQSDRTAALDTSKSTISSTVSSDVNECIQKIYDNPAALKQLLTTLMRDKETMHRVHRELANDPETRQLMQEMRKEMESEMHNGMHNGMDMNKPHTKENEENKESQSDSAKTR